MRLKSIAAVTVGPLIALGLLLIRGMRRRKADLQRSLGLAQPWKRSKKPDDPAQTAAGERGSSDASALASAGLEPPLRRSNTCRTWACASGSNVAAGLPFTKGRRRFAAGRSPAARRCAVRAAARPDLPSARSWSSSSARVLAMAIATITLTGFPVCAGRGRWRSFEARLNAISG